MVSSPSFCASYHQVSSGWSSSIQLVSTSTWNAVVMPSMIAVVMVMCSVSVDARKSCCGRAIRCQYPEGHLDRRVGGAHFSFLFYCDALGKISRESLKLRLATNPEESGCKVSGK